MSWEDLKGPVVVTGTDTGVGKTVTAAAIATAATSSGLRVAVVKPAQTGTAYDEPDDISEVVRLAAPATAICLAEYPAPLAPLVAARLSHTPPLELYDVVDAVRAQAKQHDLVLIEGAGGLLVPMGVRPSGEPWHVADLALLLDAHVVVVTRAGLGTLNHTALTLEALERRSLPACVVIGAWPTHPGGVHWSNLAELRPHLAGAVPEGAGQLDGPIFQRSAPAWLTPQLYGVLDDWRIWAEEAY